METNKRQYQAPALIDQGSVVTKTLGTPVGDIWDGSPHMGEDLKWRIDEEASLP